MGVWARQARDMHVELILPACSASPLRQVSNVFYETGAGMVNVVARPVKGAKREGGRAGGLVRTTAGRGVVQTAGVGACAPEAASSPGSVRLVSGPTVTHPCPPAGAVGALKGAGRGLVDLGYRPAKGVVLSAQALAHLATQEREALQGSMDAGGEAAAEGSGQR